MGREFTAEPEKESGFVMIPEDSIHKAMLKGIDQKGPFNRKDGTQFYKLVWWFEITSGDFEGRKLRGETGTDFSVGSKFHSWAETLLGRQIPIGLAIDLDDLEGLSIEVSVKHVPDYKDPAKKWAEVDQLIPVDAAFSLEPPF